MKKSKKKFDAVQMMREIRDRLSDRFKDMSFEEEKQYIRERISVKPTRVQSTGDSTHPA